MNLAEKFLKNWQGKGFAGINDTVLLAVSGGMDSMVLAALFLKHHLKFAIAHCNFHLRGAESDGDQALVVAFCKQHQILCFTNDFDTASIVEQQKKSIQETARNLRYAWFTSLRIEHGFAAIVTAHHADDNAETMLINLMRGTGIAGLHGIPEQNGFIIRPLLGTTRKEIEQYATEYSVDYRDDSSNAKDDYLRNYLRHHILPQLETLMPGVAVRMKQTSERIGEAEQIYDAAIEKECSKLLQRRGNDYYVPVKLLANKKPLKTICYELFRPFEFTAVQAALVADDLLIAESGKFITSPNYRLIRNRDFLIVTTLKEQTADLIIIEETDKEIKTQQGIFSLTQLSERPGEMDSGNKTALVDMDKLEGPLILRRWKQGDYFYPLGMGMKKKKISRYFIDQKVPIHQKENVWLLESGKRVVWVAGFRLDERFKITDKTKNVLQIRFSPNENTG